jgi:hypothetical protein
MRQFQRKLPISRDLLKLTRVFEIQILMMNMIRPHWITITRIAMGNPISPPISNTKNIVSLEPSWTELSNEDFTG